MGAFGCVAVGTELWHYATMLLRVGCFCNRPDKEEWPPLISAAQRLRTSGISFHCRPVMERAVIDGNPSFFSYRPIANEYSFGAGVAGNLPPGPGYVVGGTITTSSVLDCLT